MKAKNMEYEVLLRHLQELGEGNTEAGLAILNAVALGLFIARKEHPSFSIDGVYEELGEFLYSVYHEDWAEQTSEAMDLIITLIRFINREHERDGNGK